MAPTVKCPTCERLVQWTVTSEYRPFCSERCKLIDLGEWATESYAIPVNPIDESGSLEDRKTDEFSVPGDGYHF
jgi:endogenous inhibitor of DNA gyrase (YacG/DUF329 family)